LILAASRNHIKEVLEGCVPFAKLEANRVTNSQNSSGFISKITLVIFKSADGCFTKEKHRFWTPQNVIFGSFGVGPARPGGQPTAQEFYDNNIKMSVSILF